MSLIQISAVRDLVALSYKVYTVHKVYVHRKSYLPPLPPSMCSFVDYKHRRRIETEGKAKVFASVFGAEFVQFLAALAVLPQFIWKKRLNSDGLLEKTVKSNRFFQNNRDKTASKARNLTNFALQTDATDVTTFAFAHIPILFL